MTSHLEFWTCRWWQNAAFIVWILLEVTCAFGRHDYISPFPFLIHRILSFALFQETLFFLKPIFSHNLSPGVPEAVDGGGATHPELEEDPAHILPHEGDHAVPLHVPDRAGVPRGRVGQQREDRRLVRGLG